ncbi:DUF5675 family protein [Siphonobacter sp. BAB-5385]|uniref:DUF5675 family protein n=1 Tax=Siphonobacter sp. BAB-5385 TaxID=1864822 RepID=UPI0015956FC9|nr:DUF5675 family protein [Siphonobacter sp. BAB-5385]
MLYLRLERKVRNQTATISQLYVNGKFECFVLEDRDRDLLKEMTPAVIAGIKVYGRTAIPAGQYKIIVNRSTRFKRDLPLLLEVPGFSGIRIHSGNSSADTEGCLLPGSWDGKGADWISNSRKAFDPLFQKIQKALAAKERVIIDVLQKYAVTDAEAIAYQAMLDPGKQLDFTEIA